MAPNCSKFSKTWKRKLLKIILYNFLWFQRLTRVRPGPKCPQNGPFNTHHQFYFYFYFEKIIFILIIEKKNLLTVWHYLITLEFVCFIQRGIKTNGRKSILQNPNFTVKKASLFLFISPIFLSTLFIDSELDNKQITEPFTSFAFLGAFCFMFSRFWRAHELLLAGNWIAPSYPFVMQFSALWLEFLGCLMFLWVPLIWFFFFFSF